jgi:hypothetical protein
MTRKRKEKPVLTDATKGSKTERVTTAPPDEAAPKAEPQSMTTEQVAEWLTEKPKKKESAVFAELVALDPSWEKPAKFVIWRDLWLDHVGGRVTSKERRKPSVRRRLSEPDARQ